MFDLSILKQIDFTDKKNIFFLATSVVLVVFIFFLIFYVILEILRMIRKIINKFFIKKFGAGVLLKKNSFEQAAINKKNIQTGEKQESSNIFPGQKVDIVNEHGENKEEKTDPFKLKSGFETKKDEHKEIEIPVSQKNKDLSKLKIIWGSSGQEIIKQDHEEIKIPTAKTFGNVGLSANENNQISNSSIRKAQKITEITTDSSIFGGKPDIERRELEYDMRNDPKIWAANKQVNLNLTSIERSKLLKEVFPEYMGRNISKNDLKLGIKKLNEKMRNIGTKDMATHEKIRKEVKFFKKIGGIK